MCFVLEVFFLFFCFKNFFLKWVEFLNFLLMASLEAQIAADYGAYSRDGDIQTREVMDCIFRVSFFFFFFKIYFEYSTTEE
jgi:hypothetical protein